MTPEALRVEARVRLKGDVILTYVLGELQGSVETAAQMSSPGTLSALAAALLLLA